MTYCRHYRQALWLQVPSSITCLCSPASNELSGTYHAVPVMLAGQYAYCPVKFVE